jgi:hypothetical protein
MVSSGLLRRVALVRTDVSVEPSTSETSVFTRATRRNNPEDTILRLTEQFGTTFGVCNFTIVLCLLTVHTFLKKSIKTL